jgi:hypothetical protein
MKWEPVILLSALAMVAAADASWPSKGDAVFICASFKGIQHPKLVSGASMKYDMPPCKQLTVTKANAKKLSWVVKDPLGNEERLEGEWGPWMFKTEEECKSQSAAGGEPKVVKSGMTFTIAPGAASSTK